MSVIKPTRVILGVFIGSDGLTDRRKQLRMDDPSLAQSRQFAKAICSDATDEADGLMYKRLAHAVRISAERGSGGARISWSYRDDTRWPPSTTMSVPVMNTLASEARRRSGPSRSVI